jgi:putative Mg2+ transporter-C (MgtC) family protein
LEITLQLEIVAEAALAMLLGGAVGLEREVRNKPAGFRTHMLVAGAAALLIGMSEAMLVHFAPGPYPDILRSDPIRVL